MLIHGIYSDVYAEDVINLELNRYLNFNLDEFEKEIGRSNFNLDEFKKEIGRPNFNLDEFKKKIGS